MSYARPTVKLELRLDKSDDDIEDRMDAEGDEYPDLHFNGILSTADASAGPNFPRLGVRGTVRRGPAPDFAIHWNITVSYGGQGQWQLNCLQIGEERSRQGFCGIWTSAMVQGEARGPCGPCMWFPDSSDNVDMQHQSLS